MQNIDKDELFKDSNILIIFIIFSFAILYFFSNSSPIFVYNGETDSNVYFTMGKAIVKGKAIYRDFFDHKGPLLYFIYAIAYLISQTDMTGVYIFESLAIGVTLFFFYKTSLFYLDKYYAFISATLSILLISAASLKTGNPEEFSLPALSIGIYLFVSTVNLQNDSNKNGSLKLFLHGLLCGYIILLKINLSLFWLPILVALIYSDVSKKKYKSALLNIFYFIGGVFALLLPVMIYLYAMGALKDFFYAYIKFNALYSNFSLSINGFKSLITVISLLFRMQAPVFLTLIIGIFLFSMRFKDRPNSHVIPTILSSFIMLFGVIYFHGRYYNYYVLPLTAFALFSSIVLADFLKEYLRELNFSSASLIFFLIIVTMVSFGTNTAFINYIINKNDCFMKDLTPYNMAAEIIKEDKDRSCAVMGKDCLMYTLTDTLPPIKFFYLPLIKSEYFPYPRREQLKLVEEGQINYLLYYENAEILSGSYYVKPLDKNLFNKHYSLIYSFREIVDKKLTTYYLYKRK